jgi:hypothetical protein
VEHGLPIAKMGLNSFHEKAGGCQTFSFIFSLYFFFGSSSFLLLFTNCSPFSKAAPVAILPFALFVSDIRSVQGGCSRSVGAAT